MSSTLKVDNITDAAGTGSPSFPNGLPAIGEGQTWQDVSSSRFLNTAYQNTTGKPLMVAARIASSSTNIEFQISENSSTWITVSESIYIASGRTTAVIVPTNHYYRTNSALGSISYWAELR